MRAGVHRVLLAAIVGVFSLLATQFASAGLLVWFDCTDCPLRIPLSGTFGTTESVLDIDDSRTIEDLDVFIDLDHTFPEDLDIFLEAPGGTIVQLFNEFDGDVDITDVTFDDEALTSISSVGAPFGPGSFRPDPGFLSDFDGLSLSGEWTLRIVDNVDEDDGTLHEWSIHAEVVQVVPEPATFTLLGFGLAVIGLARRRRLQAHATTR